MGRAGRAKVERSFSADGYLAEMDRVLATMAGADT
jgi:hypothetical protein